MEQDCLFGLTSASENIGGKTLLVFSGDNLRVAEMTGFQVEMLAHNKLPGILSMHVREQDGQVRLCYDVSGRTQFAGLLKRRKITGQEFLRILDRLAAALLTAANNLLDDKCFVLHADYLFIEPKTLELGLVYLPMETDRELTPAFRSLVAKLLAAALADGIDIRDDVATKLMQVVSSGEFSLRDFARQLKALRMVGGDQELHGPGNARPVVERDHCGVAQKRSGLNGEAGLSIVEKRRRRDSLEKAMTAEAADRTTGGDRKPWEAMPRLVMPSLATVSVLLVVVLVAEVFLTRKMDGRAGMIPAGDVMIAAGLILLIYLAISGYVTKRRRDSLPMDDLPGVHETSPECGRRSIPRYVIEPATATTEPGCNDQPVLLRHLNGLPAADSSHRPIVRSIDGSYFILAADERVDTLLNDMRLASGQWYQLYDQDRIVTSGEEYLFELPGCDGKN